MMTQIHRDFFLVVLIYTLGGVGMPSHHIFLYSFSYGYSLFGVIKLGDNFIPSWHLRAPPILICNRHDPGYLDHLLIKPAGSAQLP